MASGDGKVRVLVADRQSLFRDAVRLVLSDQADLEVVGEAGDGLEAVAEIQRTGTDVAVLDAGLPRCNGMQATQLITERYPWCRVIVLSEQDDEWALMDAIEAGATGFLTKQDPLEELIEATRAVHRGEALVPPRMLGALLARLIRYRRDRNESLRRAARLTRREREVIALLARGADNEAIAEALVISPETARTHIQNALAKLGVHSRLEAAAFVVQNGILEELEGRGPAPDRAARGREARASRRDRKDGVRPLRLAH